MNAFGYLLFKTLKNRLLNLRKKPFVLIIYAFCAFFFALMIIYTLVMKPVQKETFVDIRILYSIVAGIALFYLILFISSGLGNGGSFFNMADVNMLFSAPISSKKILIYGIVKQFGSSLLTSVFILCQIPNIVNGFGIYETYKIICIFILYAFIFFFCQLMTIIIYILTSKNRKRRKLVIAISIGLLVILGAYCLFLFMNSSGLLETLYKLIESKFFYCVPVAGWSVMFLKGIMTNDFILTFISIAVFIIVTILIIGILCRGKADFYEDVLDSTQLVQKIKDAAKDGKQVTVQNPKLMVKDSLLGINKGTGAKAIFYRQRLEAKRKSGSVYITVGTVISAIILGIVSYFLKTNYGEYIILAGLCYLSFFSTFVLLPMELRKPYVFLIPEPSYKKLFYTCLIRLRKPVIEGILFFFAVGIVRGTSPMLMLFLALSYAAVNVISVSVSVLGQRIFGIMPNKTMTVMLEIVIELLLLMPGIIATVILTITLPPAISFLGLLPIIFNGLLISGIIFICCRNLFDRAEMGD